MSGESTVEDRITLSRLLERLVASLNQLKEPSFSLKELNERGVTTSFQDFPCLFDLRHESQSASGTVVTHIRSGLKQIPVDRVSVPCCGVSPAVKEGGRCLTCLEVSMEHSKTSAWKAFWGSQAVRALVVVATAALSGYCCVWLAKCAGMK